MTRGPADLIVAGLLVLVFVLAGLLATAWQAVGLPRSDLVLFGVLASGGGFLLWPRRRR
jgi:hypothetical protein